MRHGRSGGVRVVAVLVGLTACSTGRMSVEISTAPCDCGGEASIEITVRDGDSRGLLAGARVELRRIGSDTASFRGETAEAGTFRVTAVPAARYQVRVFKRGYSEASVGSLNVAGGRTVSVRLRLWRISGGAHRT